MYISSLYYQNVGPIGNLNLQFRKNERGLPVPLVIVGKNGSGKSILLSNIVDAFYEIADEAYDNAMESNGKGNQYYKEISPSQIKIGQNHMIAHICFEQSGTQFEYLFKSGTLSYDEYTKSRNITATEKLNWKDIGNFKGVTVDKKDVIDIFGKNVVCFFSPNRYFKPVWMGSKYHDSNDMDTYSLRSQYNRRLNNPITAVNIPDLTLQWLFDIITDSRADLKNENGKYTIAFPNQIELALLSISRNNTEQVMSQILGENVIFKMGNRSFGKRRFSVCRASDGTIIVPSLDALSTGQLALFNLFATIIRYADVDNISLSYRLGDISGIVVIDEIELHLHTKLQREILPKLIKLFPKIQFIITSHSPLFLLGMQEQFGDDGYDVIDMPSGNKISVEQFSEFENAYLYFTKTERYQNEIRDAISAKKDKPLIITEGATDWKHMKAAYNHLISDPQCPEWLRTLEFDFLEYEPKNSTAKECCKLEMSGSHLQTMCEQYCLIQQPQKMIFIADADVPKVTNALSEKNAPYKSWGNRVYSIVLPLPDFRKSTPEICIEHYYSDAQIRTPLEIGDIERRLYMGNEFDSDGLSLDGTMFCNERNSCGPDKVRIIDGHEKSPRVYRIGDKNKTNVALSKMKFATAVLKSEPPFDQMDFSNFIPLFEIIRDILSE